MCDWCKAEEHLSDCEKELSLVDSAGFLVLKYVIEPMRARLNRGERSETLFNEIMATQN